MHTEVIYIYRHINTHTNAYKVVSIYMNGSKIKYNVRLCRYSHTLTLHIHSLVYNINNGTLVKLLISPECSLSGLMRLICLPQKEKCLLVDQDYKCSGDYDSGLSKNLGLGTYNFLLLYFFIFFCIEVKFEFKQNLILSRSYRYH